MENKKILFIYYKLFKAGGVTRVLVSLANELVNKGKDVTILVLINNKSSFYYLDERVNVISLDTFSHWGFKYINTNLNKYFSNLPYKNNIKNYVYDFGQWQMLNEWINKNHHNYNVIISSWYKLSAQLSLNKNVANKTLAWEHANFEVGGVLWNKLLRKNYKNLKAVVSLNSNSFNHYSDTNKNSLLIPNIIGDPFESFTEKEILTKENTLIYVGRLDADKNVNELLDILKNVNLKDFIIKIIGDGPSKGLLEKKVVSSEYLCNKVEFLGLKNISEIFKELRKSKIFLFTSKTECLPTVLIEGLFTSNVLLAYDCSYGPSDIINENNGFLIPMHDKEMFREKLQYLIDNPSELERISKSSFEDSNKWKKNKIMNSWMELLND